MSKPKFKLQPDEELFLFAGLKPEIVVCPDAGCGGAKHLRVKHTLHIENHCVSVKQLFRIKYSTDTDAALICKVQQPNTCRGGITEYEKVFPTPQSYWQGTEKKIVRFICWRPGEHDPDFNLQVQITTQAYSQGSSPEELEGMEGNTCLNAYGSWEESDS